MLSAKLQPYLPHTWSHVGHLNDYQEVEIPMSSECIGQAMSLMTEFFSEEVKRITRVENPFLYGHFLLKKAEYESSGGGAVRELFHCTHPFFIQSILSTNLDWRKTTRARYGKGVNFSLHPEYANKTTFRYYDFDRAMIVADVLVDKIEDVAANDNSVLVIPTLGYDTTCGCKQVYVKFYDNEFYPKYVIYYKRQLFPWGH